MKYGLTLDRNSRTELSQQIYQQIKDQILSGALKPGVRIASSRLLAESLDVSRPTINVAFEQLISEGYLESRHGSGTYVQSALKTTPTKQVKARPGRPVKNKERSHFKQEAEQASVKSTSQTKSSDIVFQFGHPELGHFPHAEWSRLYGRITRTATKSDLISGPRLFYLTPSHQFPTGVTMSLPRRLELLDYAKQTDSIILEDDFDSEYHAHGKPIPSLMSLDKQGCVIYSGTFNQLLFPTIGLGYIIVPKALVPLYERGRALSGEAVNSQLQKTLAAFIDSGDLERHWKRTRSLYSDRRNTLIESLQKHFKGQHKVQGDQCGIFITVNFDLALPTGEVVNRARDNGVIITPTEHFCANKQNACQNQFILGFGTLTESRIKEGIKRLARAVQ
ncbi:MAG: PLP-dependent aminotransferase family protein [Candidatus Obscuribacter sp.]|nr:PLP-dependent aminotransferase family protein [Candidatus Obscuribacter sp.]